MTKMINCNLCGSGHHSVVYKTYEGDISTLDIQSYKVTEDSQCGPLRIVKCSQCGLIYANPRPSVARLIANYKNMIDPAYLEEERGRRLAAQSMLLELKRLKKFGRLLDVGCAVGFLLDEARQSGWEVYGIDLSKWAVEYAQNELKLKNVSQAILRNAHYPSNFFDAVVLKDSIEHLTDPKSTLIEIRRILKPDGILCVNTPDISSLVSRILRARWWGIKQVHLYYFNRKSLRQMLDRAGFFPVKTKTHGRVFTMNYLLQKLKGYNESLCKMAGLFCGLFFRKDQLVHINLGDQIEVYARKIRKLKYLDELEIEALPQKEKDLKVTAVLPAYNAEKTLKKTVADISRDAVNEIILVDDASCDGTVRIAKSLGLKVFVHEKNKGYGANQKTCFTEALKAGADIVVMVHPDYQYDPKVIPELIGPIKNGKAAAVFGSRMMKHGALEGGMPSWKHNANILLTALENVIFGTYLTEYHSGFRAYSAEVLKSVPFERNNDGFVFDTEIIAQILLRNFKIEEIPIRTRYFDEASTIKLWPSILYGLGILNTLLKYILHTRCHVPFKQFD